MIVSRASALSAMVWAKSRCPAGRSPSSGRLLMPMTAFIGVRTSWLMLARNSDLARVARMAVSRASSSWPTSPRSSASRAFSSVMSV